MFANHQIRHQAFCKVGCQNDDCRRPVIFIRSLCGYVLFKTVTLSPLGANQNCKFGFWWWTNLMWYLCYGGLLLGAWFYPGYPGVTCHTVGSSHSVKPEAVILFEVALITAAHWLSCQAHLNSTAWATWAIWAATKKYSLSQWPGERTDKCMSYSSSHKLRNWITLNEPVFTVYFPECQLYYQLKFKQKHWWKR